MFNSPGEIEATHPAAPSTAPLALDLNFLPERYRRRRLRFASLRPWLLMLGLAVMLYPGLTLSQRSRARLAGVQAQFDSVSTALDTYQPLAEERAALEARLEAAQAERAEILAAYEQIDVQTIRWSDLIPRLMAAAPPGVQFLAITQSADEIGIEGIAAAYPLPSQYADTLAAFEELESVSVQQVFKLEPETPPAEEPVDGDEPPAGGGSGDDGQASNGAAAGESASEPTLYQFEISALLRQAAPAAREPDFSE